MATGGYTKLFSSILMSSVWDESASTRIVWLTLLALSDQYGHVDGTVRSLARVARVTVDEAQAALDTFLAPDPYDRSGVNEGRRIRVEQGGWGLVNHQAYRDKMNADERRERDAERKRQARASAGRPHASENVREVSHTDQIRSDTEADTEAVEEIAPAPAPATRAAVPKFVGKQKPLPGYRRLRVFPWMVDEIIGMLGAQAEVFDLDAYLIRLDASGDVLPPDIWPWLKQRVSDEASRRGMTANVRTYETAEEILKREGVI